MTLFWHKLIEISQQYPNNIALNDQGVETSYRDMIKHAAALGERLKTNKAHGETVIGLGMEKSSEYVIGLLACWYAGLAFTPLPPSLAPERRDFMLRDTGIKTTLTLDDVQKAIITSNLDIAPAKITTADLAYVIYTSGSTGTPKGVRLSHIGIMPFITEQITAFALNSNSRNLFYLSINFDASLSDIGTTLLSGACLVMTTDNILRDGRAFLNILNDQNITHMDIPPSLLRIFAPNDMPDSLETIIIGGEACLAETIHQWADAIRLVNVYGPTEAFVCTSLNICDKNWDMPIIGQPFDHVTYDVIDGELLIGGDCLADGYQNRPTLNDEKFITTEKGRFYRTGDHVKILANGDIAFFGRIDRQFKLRGQLIAPEEIEIALKKNPSIQKAAVLKRPLNTDAQDVLIAYITGTAPNDIETQLRQSLPCWMIPHKIVTLDTMPETSTGKIDFAKLHARPISITTRQTQQPRNALEQKIWHIWAKILKHDNFGTTERFFDIGGDSLNIIKACLDAEAADLPITPAMIVAQHDIQSLALILDKNIDHNAANACDLKQKTAPDDAMLLLIEHAKQRSENTDNKDIFITGAAGFLGSRLLVKLATETNANLHCIIRAKDTKHAKKRIKNAITQQNLPEIDMTRIQTYCGDLSQNQFGLDTTTWHDLCANIDSIYHCAAWVNMVQNYDTLAPSNVHACAEVLKLALNGKRKIYHHISTLSVFVATDQNTGTLYETDQLDNVQMVYGGYGQSKFAAEYMLLQIPPQACDIRHYRFGLITGDSQTGQGSNRDFINMFINGTAEIGYLPAGYDDILKIDITPVDYAVDALFACARQGKEHIYHIANKQSLSLGQLASMMHEMGYKIEKIPANIWMEKAQSKQNSIASAAAYLALCRCFGKTSDYTRNRSMDLFQATDVLFDTTNTDKYAPHPCPAVDAPLIRKYIAAGMDTSNTKEQAHG